MKVNVEYWSPKNVSVVTETGFRYLDNSSGLKRVEEWDDEPEAIFKKFNKLNNSLRYCNGSHYKFEDSNIQVQYRAWYDSLDEGTKFNMFYGNGVVD